MKKKDFSHVTSSCTTLPTRFRVRLSHGTRGVQKQLLSAEVVASVTPDSLPTRTVRDILT